MTPVPRRQTTPTQTEVRVVAAAAFSSTSSALEIYENPKRRPDDDDNDDDDDDVADDGFVEDEAQTYGRKKFGIVARPYLTPYLYKRIFLDTV